MMRTIVPLEVEIQYDVNRMFAIPIKNIRVQENDFTLPVKSYTVFLTKFGLDILNLDWKGIRKLSRKYKVFSIYYEHDGMSIHLQKKDILDWLGVN